MDALSIPYFHFRCVLKLPTSHRVRKEFHCQKWGPYMYMARRPFSKPIRAKEERNAYGPPSANHVLSTAKPRSSHAFGYTHPLVQNLSPKNIAPSDIIS